MRYTQVLSKALLIFTSVLPMVIFCICGGENALFIAAAVVVHEFAHLAALKICGGRIRSFSPAPFGLCIDYDASTLSLRGELIVSAAGCLANLAVAAAAVVCFAALSIDFMIFGIVNAALALMNLIPIYPLDGYRVLYLILSSLLMPFTASRISFAVSYIFGLLCFLAASYLLLTSATGIYPLLFSVYIFAGNAKIFKESAGF